MSELLEAAAAALDTPSELVRRSAAARAEASGSTMDDILTAWAGGAPAAVPESAPAAAPETAPTAEAPAAAVAVEEPPLVIPTAVAVEAEEEPEPEEPLEPAAMSQRLKTAVRIGAWTGAALGVIGFLMASSAWGANTLIDPDVGPVIAVDPNGVLLGSALISVVFGAIVAGLSRAGASWANPAMQLSNSKTSTVWLGAVAGLLSGIVGGVLLNGQGTEIEGSEGLIQIPILGTMLLIVIGGAILGALTAALPQLLGTPVAVAPEDEEEVAAVRARLGNAIGIPMAGLLLLVLLVLPFAYALIESNHLTSGGASVIAILTAGGILGFAALSGTRPQMKISFGELMVALAGIGTVLLIIIAVLFIRSIDEHEAEDDGQAAVIELTI